MGPGVGGGLKTFSLDRSMCGSIWKFLASIQQRSWYFGFSMTYHPGLLPTPSRTTTVPCLTELTTGYAGPGPVQHRSVWTMMGCCGVGGAPCVEAALAAGGAAEAGAILGRAVCEADALVWRAYKVPTTAVAAASGLLEIPGKLQAIPANARIRQVITGLLGPKDMLPPCLASGKLVEYFIIPTVPLAPVGGGRRSRILRPSRNLGSTPAAGPYNAATMVLACVYPPAQAVAVAGSLVLVLALVLRMRPGAGGPGRLLILCTAASAAVFWLGAYRFSPLGFADGRVPLLRGFRVTRPGRTPAIIESGKLILVGSTTINEIEPLILPAANATCSWQSSGGGAIDDPGSCDIAYQVPHGASYDVLKVFERSTCGFPPVTGSLRFGVLP